MEEYKILVMEDDEDINRLLRTILSKKGYRTEGAFSGSEGRLRLSVESFDLILLDLMLPGLSGEEFLREIRGEENVTPVIVISARTALEDKVSALSLGADDYMTKPFEAAEVLARVEAQLRRFRKFAPRAEAKEETDRYLTFCDLRLDRLSRRAEAAGAPLTLTATEFDLLWLLMSDPDRVFTREALYTHGWGGEYYGEDNTVNVHISNIRNKLGRLNPGREYIKTVWGIGFKMADGGGRNK
ncbi:response regulator transcription factor [Bacilliculturomica massiliensis]|uniref:response regulator transcription factor n=1 Tax=Bacilliculturomica massiliensis TaxID=1917867 RepID=UPI001032403F|nr:response regulator transcription factor [Bacilliculturomica massiliensis]